jgi:propanol-preferring alcohol dehydrogenase
LPPWRWKIRLRFRTDGRSIYGSFTCTPIESEDTLAFSVLENIRPMIETFPLEKAADAYARMMQGKARFRVVLVTD